MAANNDTCISNELVIVKYDGSEVPAYVVQPGLDLLSWWFGGGLGLGEVGRLNDINHVKYAEEVHANTPVGYRGILLWEDALKMTFDLCPLDRLVHGLAQCGVLDQAGVVDEEFKPRWIVIAICSEGLEGVCEPRGW